MDDLLSTLMSFLDEEDPPQQQETEQPQGLDPTALLKIAQVMEELSKDSDDTRLLYALRPYLRPKRQAKVELAANLCRLMRLMPKLMEGTENSGFAAGSLVADLPKRRQKPTAPADCFGVLTSRLTGGRIKRFS